MKPILPNDNAGEALANQPVPPVGTIKDVLAVGQGSDGASGAVSGVGPALDRRQFVLGVFHDPPGALEAIHNLLVGEFLGSQLLLVAGSQGQKSRTLAADGPTPIQSCQFNVHIDNDDLLRHAIAAGPPFAPLWESMRVRPNGHDVSKGGMSPRIYSQLIHHLAAGAAVLIVRIQRPEQQRSAARALLDCKCDVLLTHEVSAGSG
jgi:hypothetical protein